MNSYDQQSRKHHQSDTGDGETRAEAKGVDFRVNFDDERLRNENRDVLTIFLNEIGLILDTLSLAAPGLIQWMQRQNGDVQEIPADHNDKQYIDEEVNKLLNFPGAFKLDSTTGFVATVRNTERDEEHNVSIDSHKKEHPGLWMRFRTADPNNTYGFEVNTWGGIIDSLGDFHSAENFGLRGTNVIDEVMDKNLTLSVNVLKKNRADEYQRVLGVRLQLMTSNSRNITVFMNVFNVGGEKKQYKLALTNEDFNVNTVNSIKERIVDLANLYNREYRNKGT